jgi:hypothetical protein
MQSSILCPCQTFLWSVKMKRSIWFLFFAVLGLFLSYVMTLADFTVVMLICIYAINASEYATKDMES